MGDETTEVPPPSFLEPSGNVSQIPNGLPGRMEREPGQGLALRQG